MATIDRSRIAELMKQARDLQDGSTKVGLLEEAVRLADLLADVSLGFDARVKLIEAANFSGAPEKSLVAFSWCLAKIDREPGRFPEYDTLWSYKWVINSLADFPQIPRPRIMAALADFTQRIERAGYGMRPVYKVQTRLAGKMGDLDEYRAAHDRWADSPRGGLSDCMACDRDEEVEYLIDMGRDEEALAEAGPILDGSERCHEVPHATLGLVLLPLLRLGRVAEAVPLHLRGYRMINRNREFLYTVNEHLKFLALTDNLDKGLKLFEAHLSWTLDTFELSDRFRFSLASGFLFQRLGTSGKDSVRLRLPESFPGYQASGRYVVADLTSWLESDAAGLARRFDERNGNDWYASKIEASRGWHDLVTPHSVKKSRKSNTDPPN
jgi:hypothetical protein